MGKIRRWFDFFFSEEKNVQKNNNKRKRGWGCVSCSNFDLDSPRYSAPQNPAPIVIETDYCKHDDYYDSFEIIHIPHSNNFSRSLNEDAAAIKIQTAFRRFMARKQLRSLSGLMRLKSLTNGNAVKRQTSATLQCMQTMARVQAQIHARRIRMLEENQALQRQFQLKHEKEVEKLRMSEEWDDTLRSKEQIEAQLQNKQEAATKRERALAYAFNHQWKGTSRKSTNPTYMDLNNPQWSWSWMERWNASRPWENKITTLPSKTHTTTTRRTKSSNSRNGSAQKEEDSSSTRPKRQRRHSICVSSFKDDESLVSMTLTHNHGGKANPIRCNETQYCRNKKSNLDALSVTASVRSSKRLSKDAPAVPGRGQSGPHRVRTMACKQ